MKSAWLFLGSSPSRCLGFRTVFNQARMHASLKFDRLRIEPGRTPDRTLTEARQGLARIGNASRSHSQLDCRCSRERTKKPAGRPSPLEDVTEWDACSDVHPGPRSTHGRQATVADVRQDAFGRRLCSRGQPGRDRSHGSLYPGVCPSGTSATDPLVPGRHLNACLATPECAPPDRVLHSSSWRRQPP